MINKQILNGCNSQTKDDKWACSKQENTGKKIPSSEVGGIAGDHLRSFIERIERLEEEKKSLAEDIKEVYAEAKGTGFDVKIMRQLVRLRKMEDHDREEQEEILDLYKRAIGMN